MSMTSEERWQRIVQSLEDKSYRDAFVAAEIETGIPFQIKAMRKSRGWNQNQLAAAAGMTQARISVLENADYEGAVNVKTLEKLAAAFDVGLMVRFAAFSDLVDWTIRQSTQGHDVPAYAKDEKLRRHEIVTSTVQSTATFTMADLGASFSIAGVATCMTYGIEPSEHGALSFTGVNVTVSTPITTSPVAGIHDLHNRLAA